MDSSWRQSYCQQDISPRFLQLEQDKPRLRTSIGFPSNPYNTHCQGAIFHICESSQGMENPQNRKSCLTEGTSLSLGYTVTDFICIFFVHFFLRSNRYYRWFRRGTSEISEEIWAITGNTTRMEREAKNLHEMTRKIKIHDVWNCMASDWDVSPRFRSNVIKGHGSGKS